MVGVVERHDDSPSASLAVGVFEGGVVLFLQPTEGESDASEKSSELIVVRRRIAKLRRERVCRLSAPQSNSTCSAIALGAKALTMTVSCAFVVEEGVEEARW